MDNLGTVVNTNTNLPQIVDNLVSLHQVIALNNNTTSVTSDRKMDNPEPVDTNNANLPEIIVDYDFDAYLAALENPVKDDLVSLSTAIVLDQNTLHIGDNISSFPSSLPPERINSL